MCGELASSRRFGDRNGRFIPACAGNSGTGCRRQRTAAVHPRVCGELAKQLGAANPRFWFIPACAGNSPREESGAMIRAGSSPRVRGTRTAAPCRRRSSPVHPRVCGELVAFGRRPHVADRFIPACAGNSPCEAQSRQGWAVHPRVCGELYPRVEEGDAVTRFIPACAGNSKATAFPWATPPRFIPACAGNSPSFASRSTRASGSSPRVRGTPERPTQAVRGVRFIPACAGNSATAPDQRRRWSVHPRVCGELAPMWPGRTMPNGSSPRVRGTPQERWASQ